MARKHRGLMVVTATVAVALWALVSVSVSQAQRGSDGQDSGTISEGTLSIEFNVPALEQLGWDFVARGSKEGTVVGHRITFPVLPASTVHFETAKDARHRAVVGTFKTRGALLLTGVGDRVVIGNMTVTAGVDGTWTVSNTLGDSMDQQEVLHLSAVATDYSTKDRNLRMLGELSPARSWATGLGFPEAAGVTIGVMSIDVDLGAADDLSVISPSTQRDLDTDQDDKSAPRIGPDVVVGDLYEVTRFGRIGDITAYAVGTNACNYGDERASWVSYTKDHPVIAQNMYRLKGGRFEQIGLSWVKHGFYAVSQDFCNLGCPDPTDGSELGVGCSDPYSGYLNGVQGNMSLLSDINAYSGCFPYPWTAPDPTDLTHKRLQVHDADLDPDLNADATYFVQGHYVNADDCGWPGGEGCGWDDIADECVWGEECVCIWGNQDNNASYRRVNVVETEPNSFVFNVYVTNSTQRGEPAIRAWRANDGDVFETDVRVPGEGLFILAAKVTELFPALYWHYEFALQNLNSDCSAGSFTVEIPGGSTVNGIGFHDVDYHSGEIYDLTDWTHTVDANAITWSTDSYDVNPNANALRFGTIYNFRFDADFSPRGMNAIIGMFKPCDPTEVTTYLEIGCSSAPPVHDPVTPNVGFGTKNRYLSFALMPHMPGRQHAIKATLVSLPGYEYAEGRTMWVQEPAVVTEASGSPGPVPPPTTLMARLDCEPFWTDWSVYDMIHVYDASVVPGAVYEIRSIAEECDLAEQDDYSAPLQVDASAIGDIVGDCGVQPCSSPNGVIDFMDISAAVEKFKNTPGAPMKARADVINATISEPIPDRIVDFVDISYIVDAFRSTAVPPPGPPVDDPCPP